MRNDGGGRKLTLEETSLVRVWGRGLAVGGGLVRRAVAGQSWAQSSWGQDPMVVGALNWGPNEKGEVGDPESEVG